MKNRRTRTSRTRRALEIFLLVAGLTGVGIWGWSHVHMAIYQMWANRVLEHRKIPPAVAAVPRPPAPPLPARLPNGALLGRLEIPRLHMRSVVREGAGRDTLEVALGHIPGTPLPGQGGNAAIAGHRDTLFRGLRNITKDDLIEFDSPYGTYDYKVESTGIVKPKDVEVLKPGNHPEMTLVTCYPFYYVGSAPDRFIVKARLVNSPMGANAPTVPAPPKATKVASVAPPRTAVHPVIQKIPATQKIGFQMGAYESRQVLPGVWLGVSKADAPRQRASIWIFTAPDHQTIALRNQGVREPVFFHSNDRQQRELMITSVSPESVSGYLMLYRPNRSPERP